MKNARKLRLPRLGKSVVRSIRFPHEVWDDLIRHCKALNLPLNREIVEGTKERIRNERK